MVGNNVRSQEVFSEVLHDCLEKVENGQESVDSLLGQYPEFTDNLRPPLEAAIWLFRKTRVFDPRPGFVSASRRRLVNRIQTETATIAEIRRGLGGHRARYALRKYVFISIISVTAFVVIILSVHQGAAMAVLDTGPGDAWYPIKLASERIQLAYSLTDVGDASLEVEFTQRRLDDLVEVVRLGRFEQLEESVEYFVRQFDRASQACVELKRIGHPAATELFGQLEQTLAEGRSSLVSLAFDNSSDFQVQIQRAIDVTSSNLATLQILKTSEGYPHTSTLVVTFTQIYLPSSTLAVTATPWGTSTIYPAMGMTLTQLAISESGVTITPDASEIIEVEKTLRPEVTPKPTNTHRPTHKATQEKKTTKAPKP